MVQRVRHPNTPPKDVDLGPAVGRTHRYEAMAKTIDDLPVWTFRNLPEHRKS